MITDDYKIFLKNCLENNNYDILSILDFKNFDIILIIDIFEIIRNNINDRKILHIIKNYYKNKYYENNDIISKLKYVMILCIGNKYNKKDIFIKHLENFKNNLIEDEILLLEERLKKLYNFPNSDHKSDDENHDNGNDGIIIKKKIMQII